MAYLGSKPANILTDPVIADGTITSAKLANNAVTYAKLDSNLQQSGMKNRIINGAMVIDQRNAGASFSSSANGAYNLDRWYNQNNSGGTRFSVQQNAGSVTPPVGFTNYLGVTSTSAYSVVSTDVIGIGERIEGYNTADLSWGTANAKTITLSFWVRSSLTGTFGGSLSNSDASRFYPFTYTISSANTWEQKSVTIAGDTSGTWLTTNGVGISLLFNLGTGSTYTGTAGAWTGSSFYAPTGATSVVGTNGATFYITGVQLEVGTQATSFEYRQYGTELALCQRYARLCGAGFVGNATAGATNVQASMSFGQPMRASPSISLVSGSNVNFVTGETVQTASSPAISTTYLNANGVCIRISGFSGNAAWVDQRTTQSTSDNWLLATAEL